MPYDLTAEGRFLRDGYLAVTRERLFVLEGGRICGTSRCGRERKSSARPRWTAGCCSPGRMGRNGSSAASPCGIWCGFPMSRRAPRSLPPGSTGRWRAGSGSSTAIGAAAFCPARPCVRNATGGRSLGLRHYWDLCSRYTLPLLLRTLLTGVVAVINVGIQFIQRDFIDNVLRPASGTLEDVARFFGIMLALTLAGITLNITNTLWSNHLGTRVSRDLRARVFDKINQLSLSFLNVRQAGGTDGTVRWKIPTGCGNSCSRPWPRCLRISLPWRVP